MVLDFLIVGQGLAGTCLAHQLSSQGKSFKILQNNALPSSSKVAGGMFNPVTGKRLALTWKQEELFDYMQLFYRGLEQKLKAKFLHIIPIYRPYKNENQKSQFVKAIEKKNISHLVSSVEPLPCLEDLIEGPIGGILTKQSGRLDVPEFLKASTQFFNSMNAIKEGHFDSGKLRIKSESVEYQNQTFKNVVFCQGIHSEENILFNWLPLRLVKGETLDVSLEGKSIDLIVNQGSWLMPLDEGKYKMGSTYDWDNLNVDVTAEAREGILEKTANFLKCKPKVLAQFAGIRPAVIDRRPIIGSHPKYKNVFILNGLGTKGVSLAPLMAKYLLEHILEGKEIDSESTINRFYPLYS
ncbi:MAG: glycine/D-amino acid oxidase-like deaminating enzyme [Arcticibacterium sp.]|jgi:glycine/D-amino acid oxidase-like deaminating enzyme